MRLDDALKAYLITLVQAHYNTVNIIKIKLRPLSNSRDFQLPFWPCFVCPSTAKSTYMHVNREMKMQISAVLAKIFF